MHGQRHLLFWLILAAAATLFTPGAEADNFDARFSLEGMPCPRPANITLKTAPRFFYTLTIPE